MIRILRYYQVSINWLNQFQPLFALCVRLYLARIFFTAGLMQWIDWRYTLTLFRFEYEVPGLFSPEQAAILAIFTEIFFSVLLVLGLGTRVSAFVLFLFNAIAVTSDPGMTYMAFSGHMLWGTLLVFLIIYGPGRWSLDKWVLSWYIADHSNRS